MKGKPADTDEFEREVLGVLLVELRRAMRLKAQLSIIIDPFTMGGGTYIFAGPNEKGTTYTIETKPSPRRRAARRK